MKRFAWIGAFAIALSGLGVGVASATLTNRGPICHRGRLVVFGYACPRGFYPVQMSRGPEGPRGPRGGRGPRGPQGVPGASQLANASITSNANTLGATSTATFDATCPSGTRAISGGASGTDLSGATRVDFSYPSSIASGIAQDWSVVVTNTSSTPKRVVVYAICA